MQNPGAQCRVTMEPQIRRHAPNLNTKSSRPGCNARKIRQSQIECLNCTGVYAVHYKRHKNLRLHKIVRMNTAAPYSQ